MKPMLRLTTVLLLAAGSLRAADQAVSASIVPGDKRVEVGDETLDSRRLL